MAGVESSSKLWLAAGQKIKEREYWLAKLAGDLTKSSFPYDHTASHSQEKSFQAVDFSFNDKLSGSLLKLSAASDSRLYIILATGLIILLHKYSGCENKDIIIGAPILKTVVQGELINKVLVLRNQIEEHVTFKDLLFQVRQTVIEADEHCNYPGELLTQQLNLPPGHDVLFDAAIMLENIHDRAYLDHVKPNVIFSFVRADKRISGQVEYNSNLYERYTIERIIGHFKNLMLAATAETSAPAATLDILSPAEKEELLFVFNDTTVAYPREKPIHEIFSQQQERNPDAVAVASCQAVLTYEHLNRQADDLAEMLHQRGASIGMPVGIFLERSIEMAVAVLGILKAGGAYLPIDTAYPKERIRFMLADSRTRLLVTSRSWSRKIEKPENLEIETLFIEDRKDEPCVPPSPYLAKTDAPCLAYIMYTSGSTGRPKGVMVEHRNVVRLVINTNFVALSHHTRILQTGAAVFDAATFETWGALLNGGRLYLVDNDIVLNARNLAKAIDIYKIDTMWLSSPLFNQLMQQDENVCAKLKYLLVGGDVLSPTYIDQARRKNRELKIINGYGPTENTTFSLTYSIDRDFVENIPIGKPINNSTADILDKHGNLQPIGASGELAVGGDGLSRGYLNNPELTQEKFVSSYNISYKSYRSYKSYFPDKIYLTGDLCRRLPDGNIEFKGRVDNQVKIRGFRVECGEIEKSLLKHERVKEAVVTIKKDNAGEKYLCAYVTLTPTPQEDPLSDESTPPIARIRDFLVYAIPDYMIPRYIIALTKMPLNPNGKIDRKALPEPQAAQTGGEFAAPRNIVEKRLAVLWALVLGNAENSVGIDADFFEIGGHSLKAARLITLIHKEFNVNLPLADLFTHPTIRELSSYLKGAVQERYVELAPVEKREYYDLSSSQKRLYLLQQWDEQATAYNIPAIFEIAGEIDREKLVNTFRRLIERHESFRTSFHQVNGQPVQIIHHPGSVDFAVEYYEKTDHIRPFDLAGAPLLRVGLIELSNARTLLAIDMHHIISDGTSMAVLTHEFMETYAGGELPAISIQYKDFASRQASPETQRSMRNQEQYWLERYAGEIPVLNLPTDFPRPMQQSFAGKTIRFEISPQDTARLVALAQEHDVTLFMVLLAAFNILLTKLSGQEDIVVGSPVAGRRHAGLVGIIGMFVNTLVMRNYPCSGKTFRHFLSEVAQETLAALENQEYPYEVLVEKTTVRRDAGRNPLFDVMFVLQNIEMSRLDSDIKGIDGNLKLKPYKFDYNIAKFDLMLICEEVQEQDEDTGIPRMEKKLNIAAEYCTALFKEETIRRFVRYFMRAAAIVGSQPDAIISSIDILSETEKQELLLDFNRINPGFPGDKTLHGLFSEQVERTPEHIALVGNDDSSGGGNRRIHISFRQLEQEAACLAEYLLAKSAAAEGGSLIGLMVERSPNMIIGILAILEMGSGYVPLNTRAPAARNRYILEECGIKLLLAGRSLFEEIEALRDLEIEAVYIEDRRNEIRRLSAVETHRDTGTKPVTIPPTGRIAYVIFTSGSTGRPKGVPITHTNVTPLLHWGYKHVGITPADNIQQNPSYFFDYSVWEIFMSLSRGAALFTIPEETVLDPLTQLDLLERDAITVLDITPIHLQTLLNLCREQGLKALSHLKCLTIAGEKLTVDLVERAFASVPGDCEVFNLYGPTETAILSAVLAIDRSRLDEYRSLTSIPIGDTVANSDLIVLDRDLALCPLYVVGELYIGGDCLAAGYLNDVEKAAAVFVENLYRDAGVRGERLYKTGDLVRRLWDGDLEFLARIDHQVKIRGLRIELGEIEKRILEHENISEAAVIDRQRENGEKYLCAYIVPGTEANPAELVKGLKNHLARHLPDYMIPSVFVPMERMPLNPNKKIDRQALPEAQGLAQAGEYIPPRDEVEKKLAALWLEALPGGDAARPHTSASQIGAFSDFFEAGGHSLYILKLVNAIQREFSVKIGFQDIFRFPQLQAQAELIRSKRPGAYEKIESLERKGYYELSYYQKRLWLLNRFDPDSAAFNLGGRIILNEPVAEAVIYRVLDSLIQRHEAFRTYFKTTAGEVKQIVQAKAAVDLERVDLSQLPPDERENARQALSAAESTIPFDLEQAPLLRLKLVECAQDRFDLLFTMHHIVSDGWSLEVLQREFLVLYEAYKAGGVDDLAPLRIQYKEYAAWHNKHLVDESRMAAAKDFWKKQLSGELPVLELPYDNAPADRASNKETIIDKSFFRGSGGHAARAPYEGSGSFEHDYHDGKECFFCTLPQDISKKSPLTAGGNKSDSNLSAGYRSVLPALLTDELRRLGKKHQASLFMVLLSGFHLLLLKITGQEEQVIGVPGAARQHDDLHNIIGLFVNTLILRNQATADDSFVDLLHRVQEKMVQVLEYQGIPLELICGELKIKYPELAVFFNMFTIGDAGKKSLADVGGDSYHIAEVQQAKFPMVWYLTEYRDGVEINVHYKKELFKPVTIEKIVSRYSRELADIVKDSGEGVVDGARAEHKRKIRRGSG